PERLTCPLGGQRAQRAWGPFHPGREGPPRATDLPPRGGSERSERGGRFILVAKGRPERLTCPLGGQRAQRAWGSFHPSREGPPRATGLPPRGAASVGADS